MTNYDRFREAVEQVRRKPLPEGWPPGAPPAGTRVTVVQDKTWAGPWRDVFTGTVDDFGAPELVSNPVAHEGELAYWVAFDAPQYDADGQGPFPMAFIWDRYLEVE